MVARRSGFAEDQTLHVTAPTGDERVAMSNVNGRHGLLSDDDGYTITATYALSDLDGPLQISTP